MDEKTQQAIEDLAMRYKQLHLAATMEDARKKAEEVILSSESGVEKTLGELNEESKK